MIKIKEVARGRWVNRTLFIMVLAGLLVAVSSSVAMANLLARHSEGNLIGYGYGYGADNAAGEWGYGYNTYTDTNPIADTQGGCPNGTLIKTATSGTVFWVQDGMKHAIISSVAFNSWGFNWADVITVSQAKIDCIPRSSTPLHARPGTLLKVFHNNPGVFIVGFEDPEAVHGIEDQTLFNNLGLKWSNIYEVEIWEFNEYVKGIDYTDSSVLADGSLIKGSGSTVYFWEGDGSTGRDIVDYTIEPIASVCAFNSWGFQWSNITTLSDVEIGAYLLNNQGIPQVNKVMLARPGTLIKGSTACVYVTDFLARPENTADVAWTGAWGARDWARRAITSATAFSSQGFRWVNVYTVPDAEVGLYWLDGSNVNTSVN